MKNKEYFNKLKEELLDIKYEAVYIGEEGEMCTDCKTKIGALRRFKKLERETNGQEEANEIKLKDISIAYFHLAEETTQKNKESMNIEEDGWYIDIHLISPVKVWLYSI